MKPNVPGFGAFGLDAVFQAGIVCGVATIALRVVIFSWINIEDLNIVGVAVSGVSVISVSSWLGEADVAKDLLNDAETEGLILFTGVTTAIEGDGEGEAELPGVDGEAL